MPSVTGPIVRTPPRRPASQAVADDVPGGRARGRRWIALASVLAVVLLAIVGVAIAGKPRSPGHASTAGPAPTVAPAAVKATPGGPVPSSGASTPEPPPAVRLTVQGASAFGAGGVADGDNPGDARYAIAAGSQPRWHTDWYVTASFGGLKQGTGLLLDMGKTVTVTGVRIQLGVIRGADLQVRAGAAASLSAAPVVAGARGAGGTLTLRLKAPARARYVIIWFTRLPPIGSGKYEASVYNVAVTGRP
jgi:hypothetical protein